MVAYTPVEKSLLLNDLRSHVVEVLFDKVNGERRLMHCTLSAPYLPEGSSVEAAQAQDTPDVMTVWDVDANDWRRFHTDRVLYIQAVNR